MAGETFLVADGAGEAQLGEEARVVVCSHATLVAWGIVADRTKRCDAILGSKTILSLGGRDVVGGAGPRRLRGARERTPRPASSALVPFHSPRLSRPSGPTPLRLMLNWLIQGFIGQPPARLRAGGGSVVVVVGGRSLKRSTS